MPIAVKSSLDVVFWLTDQALNDREYIQPQKLHRLLYLSQAYFAVAYNGRKLMPATFVTDAFGPVEPTVFHTLAYGRPLMIEGNPLSDQVNHFLGGIWRRFGQYSPDQLTKKVAEHAPVAMAMAKGINEEIPFAEMVAYYTQEAAARSAKTPGKVDHVDSVVKPRVLRSQTGKAVAVAAWKPKAVTVKKDE
ncbi:hypothetical protein A6A04_08330 [Paramagnetospirillum marisnigri]|uniref:Antitoxin SocA-like Panacea domain-containing protein n=1 Tax=Paramagnetospirillum marisnigri TaxID=1285242 RepID=A0A178M7Q2_9PROT|nr:type II toxin-antitoxin system antitoxin SocA domain-containing protein [Paramagnetospirillum marisnigri]OAN44811.1 hypothetical protein A6A04_08330 [Paramagnetospirillum marisnigri]